MKNLGRHFTYANVAATLALVFAMAGTAVAANHYLITSTRQISPRVLRSLRGRQGATGAAGRTGPSGLAGAAGASGVTGLTGPEGPSNSYATGDVEKEIEVGEHVETTVAELTVPSGDYVAFGKVEEQNRSKATAAAVGCSLLAGTTYLDLTYTTAPEDESGVGYGASTNIVQGSFTTTASETVKLNCQGPSPDSKEVWAASPALTVTKVGSLSG